MADLEPLIVKYVLTQEDLNKKVTDKHIEVISRSSCRKWKSLYSHLEMKPIHVGDIDCKEMDEDQKRVKFFSTWKENKGSEATYTKLIRALLTIESKEDAESVCKLLHDEQQPKEELKEQQAQSNAAGNTTSSTCAKESVSLDPRVRMDLEQQLQNSCDQVRKRYASFVSRICEHLNNKKVAVAELRTFLSRLPALEDSDDFKSLSRGADTINAMIDLIGDKFASFLYYDIFQSILDEYCSDAEKCSDVLKYSVHLKDYINRHNIEEFILINPTLKKFISDSKEVCLKIDIKKTSKIAEVVEFERTIANILDIKQSMLHLYKIEDGCIILTFHIPTAIAENIFDTGLTERQIKRLQHSSVLWLKCGIYDINFKQGKDQSRDPYSDPLEATNVGSLFCGTNPDVQDSKFTSHGKWLTFQNMESINNVWCVVRDELISGRLGAVAAKCSTLSYDPLVHGTGPCTTGRISVFTSEEACIEVGMRFIQLEGVQHDIKYKTNEATRDERFAHTPRRNGPITSKTLYWNGGEPSETQTGMECPPPARNDKDDYDPASDPWKMHIVGGTGDPEHQHGKWIIKGTYRRADHDNISALFHRFKKKLEEGEIPAIRMECPSQPRNTDPEIHVFTAEANMTSIGKQLIDTVKHDIRYVIGGGSFRDDVKTLYWNKGIPSYEDSSRARDHQGILGNWRS